LIGASIGIACVPRHGTDRAGLSHAADAAMYEVKRSGKNSFAMAIGAPPDRRS
jgi:GGDEF domain-containing protein